jgi:hypothetical protein
MWLCYSLPIPYRADGTIQLQIPTDVANICEKGIVETSETNVKIKC